MTESEQQIETLARRMRARMQVIEGLFPDQEIRYKAYRWEEIIVALRLLIAVVSGASILLGILKQILTAVA